MNILSSLITLSTHLIILRSQIYFPIPIISGGIVEALPEDAEGPAVKPVSSSQFRWRSAPPAFRFGEIARKAKRRNHSGSLVDLTYANRLEV